jgi:hypothetical protein
MHLHVPFVSLIQSPPSTTLDASCFETRTGHETAATSVRRVSGEPRRLDNANQFLVVTAEADATAVYI